MATPVNSLTIGVHSTGAALRGCRAGFGISSSEKLP
jgi:hypothetical protein